MCLRISVGVMFEYKWSHWDDLVDRYIWLRIPLIQSNVQSISNGSHIVLYINNNRLYKNKKQKLWFTPNIHKYSHTHNFIEKPPTSHTHICSHTRKALDMIRVFVKSHSNRWVKNMERYDEQLWVKLSDVEFCTIICYAILFNFTQRQGSFFCNSSKHYINNINTQEYVNFKSNDETHVNIKSLSDTANTKHTFVDMLGFNK